MITIILPALIALAIIQFGYKREGMNPYSYQLNKIRIRLKRTRVRPFDCVKCLSGWLCAPFAYYNGINPFLLPAYMIGAMALGYFFEKLFIEL